MNGADFQKQAIKIDLEYSQAIEHAARVKCAALRALYASICKAEQDDSAGDIPFERPPQTEADTLDGKIMDCLQKLGYSEDALNRWCARQFPGFRGDWTDLPEQSKGVVYATFKAKVDEKAVTA